MKFKYLHIETKGYVVKMMYYNFQPRPQVEVGNVIDVVHDHLGENGWELVSVTPKIGSKNDSRKIPIYETVGYVFWYKRPYDWEDE